MVNSIESVRAMLVLEFKVKGKSHQYAAIEESIRTAQFVRNKALRYWMDNRGVNKYDLNKYCRVLAREYDLVRELNSTARQASAERAWSSISRFFENCRQQPARKDILGSRKTVVLSSTKTPVGSYSTLSILSLPTRKGSDDSS